MLSEKHSDTPGRRVGREERRAARNLARRHTAETLAPLLEAASPNWFTPEQTAAYRAELRRLYSRIAPRAYARGLRIG